MLAPLHELTGVGRFFWGPDQIQAFATMKAMIAADAMSYYPDLNKPFEIYTDASAYQLGAAIIQDGHPIAYWSKKLTKKAQAQRSQIPPVINVVLSLGLFTYNQSVVSKRIRVHLRQLAHLKIPYLRTNK